MSDIAQLKAFAQAAIDRRRDWIVSVAKTVASNPELGFREVATASLVSDKLAELGIAHEKGIALTGLKGYLDGGSKGPTVGIIGEMDSLRVPGHPDADPDSGAAHACGHHCQLGMLLGVATALSQPEVLGALSGRIALMGLPAEEFTDVEYRWRLHQEGRLGLMGANRSSYASEPSTTHRRPAPMFIKQRWKSELP